MTDISHPTTGSVLGILGLGLLSRNLMITIARQGYPVAGYDRDPSRIAELRARTEGLPVSLCGTIEEFTAQLTVPRAILVLVQGDPYAMKMFQGLGRHLNPGDLIIDGASYHHLHTPRRRALFAEIGIHFLSAGIAASGHGHDYGCRALYPELQETCRRFRPLFEAAAATASGEPCVSFVGRQIAAQLGRLETSDSGPGTENVPPSGISRKEVECEGHRSDRRDSLRQEYCGATPL